MSRFPGSDRFGSNDEEPEKSEEPQDQEVDEAATEASKMPEMPEFSPLSGDELPEEEKKIREAKEELNDVENQQELKEVLREHPILLDKFNMTLSIQNVHGYLRNINPSYIRARTEKAKTEAQAAANNSGANWELIVPVLVIITFCFAIAYKIMFSGGSGGGSGGSVAKGAAEAGGAAVSILGASLRNKFNGGRE